LGTVNAHTVRTDNPDPTSAGDLCKLSFEFHSLFVTSFTEAGCTEVNCSNILFDAFLNKLGSNLGIDQTDYIVDVARDILEAGINLTTFDLPTLGINEMEGTVESHFHEAFQESACPVLRLGRRYANKGDRTRVEEEIQVMRLRVLHIP
jgi:hypothetical protein